MAVSLAKGVEIVYSARAVIVHKDSSESTLAYLNDVGKVHADVFIDTQIGQRVRQRGNWTVTTTVLFDEVQHVIKSDDPANSVVRIRVTTRVAPIRR